MLEGLHVKRYQLYLYIFSFNLILRLHDQADIKQTSSNHQANAFKIHVHDVCSNCSMFA